MNDFWCVLLAILVFVPCFILATQPNIKQRLKNLFRSNVKVKRGAYIKKYNNLFGQKMFYALYFRDGLKKPNAKYIVHAFSYEADCTAFVQNMNTLQRQRSGNNDTYAVIVDEHDKHVKYAVADVNRNPLVYSNVDYINQRIYVEHNSHY